jgi:hypothetical protein
MRLKIGKSKAAFRRNIRELVKKQHPVKKAVTAAFVQAEKSGAKILSRKYLVKK